ncbi:MAG: S-layer homology domain-containing protein [Clostridia bacterium]|nr:S-layer homology domain-containing protein [Clostridia bacterium]
MKTIKKTLSMFTVFSVLLGLLSFSAFAAEKYSDMPEDGFWSKPALEAAVEKGLLTGYNGKLMPTESLTRAQMATIMARAFGAVEKADISAYTDVPETAWFNSAIALAVGMGLFSGSDGKMEPDRAITRQEAFVVLARALKLNDGDTEKLASFSDGASMQSWAAGPISALVEAGYVKGDRGMLRPNDSITREQFAQIMYNAIKTYYSAAGVYTTVGSGNVMVNAAGVTLKNLTVNGDLIIGEGVGTGDVYLDGVTVSGRVVVRSGGSNSIHVISGSSVGRIIIAKTDSGSVRIVTEGGSQVEIVVVDDGSDDIILEGSFGSVDVESDTPVVLRAAQVETLTVSAPNASVSLLSGSVQNTQISTAAAGAALEVSKGATVIKVESAADNAAISGDGTVGKAVVSGNNTTVGTKNTVLTVDEGTTGVTQNGNAVDGGTSTTTGQDSQPGATPLYVASVATAAQLNAALADSFAVSIRITDDITLTGGQSPAETTFSKLVTVDSGATLTVGANMKLVVSSTLTNNGTIEVAGEITPAAVADDYTGSIDAIIGEIVVSSGGTLNNAGALNVNGASCSSIRRTLVTDENGVPILDGDDHLQYENEQGPNGGLLSINGGAFVNSGTVTVEMGELTAAEDDGDNRYWGGYLELAGGATFSNLYGATVNFSGAYLNIMSDATPSVFTNSGTLNITYGTMIIGGVSTLNVTSTGTMTVATGSEVYVGITNESTEAELLISGSAVNSGTITVASPGGNALAVLSTGSLDNNGTITVNGRVNIMGALDTTDGTITNSGEFIVQYMPDVNDIVGKDNITGSIQFFAFTEAGLRAGITRGYTDIAVKSDPEAVTLTQDLTIPVGVSVTVSEGGILVISAGITLTNNGTITNEGTITNNGTLSGNAVVEAP